MIYPVDIRNLLFWFTSYDLFTPMWSKHIFTEWEEVMKRKGIPEDEIRKRLAKAQLAFPDALVDHNKSLLDFLNLPDEKDRHILAAAIKTMHAILDQFKPMWLFKSITPHQVTRKINL